MAKQAAARANADVGRKKILSKNKDIIDAWPYKGKR
jgi:hypothetical protein